ncbi:MAG: acetolactate decarboxylase [Chitinophagaceae bacterium]|nr:acetolactate decarboxylase [Chitinophagaceae bacterium]
MMNVMRKGELSGTINLDTISNKEHLYGVGPVEYLRGELLIIDGKSYQSTVAADGSIRMEETFKVRAPFFVYALSINGKKFRCLTVSGPFRNWNHSWICQQKIIPGLLLSG